MVVVYLLLCILCDVLCVIYVMKIVAYLLELVAMCEPVHIQNSLMVFCLIWLFFFFGNLYLLPFSLMPLRISWIARCFLSSFLMIFLCLTFIVYFNCEHCRVFVLKFLFFQVNQTNERTTLEILGACVFM